MKKWTHTAGRWNVRSARECLGLFKSGSQKWASSNKNQTTSYWKIEISTMYGLYEFLAMTIGLYNAP